MTTVLSWLMLLAVTGPLAKFEPRTGCYIGAFIERDGNCLGDFSLFERLAGRRHATYVTYSAYGRPFPAAWIKRVGDHGAAAHLGWEPNNGLDVVQDNAYLRGWARAARASGVPIFLRFASEMNGNWMPYSGNPAKFIEKWRIVARVMREEAPNVALVWCVFHAPENTIERYYPGDEWVDWVGVNLYSLMYHNNDPSQLALRDQPQDALRFVYQTYSARRPIMICEYAATVWCRVINGPTVGFALDKMTALYRALPTEFPRVKCIQWFSMDAVGEGLAANNYCLTTEPMLLDRYRMLITGPHWLTRVVGGPRVSPPESAPPLPTPPVAVVGAAPTVTAAGPAQPTTVPAACPPILRATPPPAVNLASLPDDEVFLPPVRSEFGLARLRPGKVLTGRVLLEAYLPADWQVEYVTFRCNGKLIGMCNHAPYELYFDPTRLEPGRYELTIRVERPGRPAADSPPLPVEVRRAP